MSKAHTQRNISEGVSNDKNTCYFPFQNNPHPFTNPSFYGKKLNFPFWKNLENSNLFPPLYGGSGFQLGPKWVLAM